VPGPPVRAHTTNTPATSPEVIHCLAPRITQRSPSRVAVVAMEPGSLPAPGSESAKEAARYCPDAMAATCRCRWASVPKALMTSATMLLTAMVTAVDAQPRAISIMARA
jgi:hypothetical protein